jgi:hypothetical protein
VEVLSFEGAASVGVEVSVGVVEDAVVAWRDAFFDGDAVGHESLVLSL